MFNNPLGRNKRRIIYNYATDSRAPRLMVSVFLVHHDNAEKIYFV